MIPENKIFAIMEKEQANDDKEKKISKDDKNKGG